MRASRRVLAAVLGLAAAPTAGAQVARNVWFGAGLGLGRQEGQGTFGLAGSAILSGRVAGPHVLTARAAGQAELIIEGDGTGASDAGLLYGRVVGGRRGFAVASAGLAATRIVGDAEGPEGYREVWAVGLPLDVQLFLAPRRGVGVGVHAFANLNRVEPFGGATLTLVVVGG